MNITALKIPDNSDLCYTFDVEDKYHVWQEWARNLHHWGLASMAIVFLQAGAPLRILAAQAAYLGQPFFDLFIKSDTLNSLAKLLENDGEIASFIGYLREVDQA